MPKLTKKKFHPDIVYKVLRAIVGRVEQVVSHSRASVAQAKDLWSQFLSMREGFLSSVRRQGCEHGNNCLTRFAKVRHNASIPSTFISIVFISAFIFNTIPHLWRMALYIPVRRRERDHHLLCAAPSSTCTRKFSVASYFCHLTLATLRGGSQRSP